jgi:polysaccharide biosynthesis/export protein
MPIRWILGSLFSRLLVSIITGDEKFLLGVTAVMSCLSFRRLGAWVLCLAAVAVFSGCATISAWLPSHGPSRDQVVEAKNTPSDLPIHVVDVTDVVVRRIIGNQKRRLFSETLGSTAPVGYIVGPGDTLVVSVWEAPPAALFGSTALDPLAGGATSHETVFPEQMVNLEGTINIPFAGMVPAAGKSLQQIEEEIVHRLTDKANQPQVMARLSRNATSNVTVVGEVTTSARVPLTAGCERLLDVLASVGGVRQPVGKITLQVTRGDQVQELALDTIIRDPKQNIVLQPGDVITALFQPFSVTVLGAMGKNDEINFEAQGITLAQAMARAGGLQEMRADARAVFIFRLVNSNALDWATPPKTTPEGKVPVIFQVNLKDPASFFVAQSFPLNNNDVLYVSNAPAAQLQKFLTILTSSIYTINGVVSGAEKVD